MIKKILFFLFKPKKMFGYFGNNSTIHFLNWFNNPQNIFIGSNCYMNYGNTLFAGDKFKIKIGNGCHFAMNILMITYSHDFNNLNIESIPYGRNDIGGDIIIKDGVWIGTRVIVLPGITIGKGAVIAAGAVVSKNVPDYEVWGGNPAKKISVRKNIEQFDKLYIEGKFRRKLK